MISFHSGIQALRNFQVKTLQEKLQSELSDLYFLGAEFVHFIKSDKKLNAKETSRLHKLLQYAPQINLSSSACNVIVTPRHGTISPWSSKASNIVHLCGLKKIDRLERGICYHFSRQLKSEELDKVLNLVLDKMTESYLEKINDAGRLFLELSPKKYQRILIRWLNLSRNLIKIKQN